MTLNQKIITKIAASKNQTQLIVHKIKHELCAHEKCALPDNATLIKTYHDMIAQAIIPPNETLLKTLMRAKIRSLSGISVITVLTKPYACPGKCVYCPTESIMPKSYLSNEPAAQRALRNKFDPWLQIASRIKMLENNGHEVQKIELIVKGGTWNAYRYDYQLWFIRRCFEVCNTFNGTIEPPNDDMRDVLQKMVNPATTFTNVTNIEIIDAPHAHTSDEIQKNITREENLLAAAQKKNETAKYRIIGLTLETRPDWIRPEEVVRMRQLGCTRVEVGLQHTSDEILKLIKRGHTLLQFKQGIKLLRDAGFKVDFHTMPQLPGSSSEIDLKMYAQLFDDPDLRPDMIKIYPCSVIRTSELYEWYKNGQFTPYVDEALFEMLIAAKQLVPRYCRISRLIRDIPSDSIEAGNKITNLRENIQAEMSKRSIFCVCLRCREYGRQIKLHPELMKETPRLFIEKYEASGGTEFFLSFEDNARRTVYAFLRLRLSGNNQDEKLVSLMPEIKNVAFIRELHTYGHVVIIDAATNDASAQHKGLGKKLMETAEKIAIKYNYSTMCVISGAGVREYYQTLGYSLEKTYMKKLLG